MITTSGKWAWYAPGNIGVETVLGSLVECVASARAGNRAGRGAVVELSGRTVFAGEATGDLLVLDAALSFWGGTDSGGTIVDGHHPQRGAGLTGRVVALPSARGRVRRPPCWPNRSGRTGPAALVLTEPDAILMLGAWAAAELYGLRLPIVVLAAADHRLLCARSGPVTVTAGPERATITA